MSVGSDKLTVKPFVVSKTDLLIRGLPEVVGKGDTDSVGLFIGAKLKTDVDSVTLNEDKTCALIHFAEDVGRFIK